MPTCSTHGSSLRLRGRTVCQLTCSGWTTSSKRSLVISRSATGWSKPESKGADGQRTPGRRLRSTRLALSYCPCLLHLPPPLEPPTRDELESWRQSVSRPTH